MKGQFLYAALAATALSLCSTAAVPAAVSRAANVTWHRDGLLTWERVERGLIDPPTIHQHAVNLAVGRCETIASGRPGIRELVVRYSQRGGGPVRRRVLWSTILQAARPRVVAQGVGGTPLSTFEAHSVVAMATMARRAILMFATGYTADSAGGDGVTAIGRRAGFGIVAVDPRIIPLGARLFIPGYGFAVAGDTGAAIVGNRIDLGFDRLDDAMRFGRRAVTVYRLR